MAWQCRAVRAAADTSSGTQDFTVSGFGTPDACIVIVTGATTDDKDPVDADAIVSYGFSDFTNEVAIGTTSEAGETRTDCFNRATASSCVYILEANGGTVDGVATASTITNGVRLTWSDNPTTGFLTTVILIGGVTSAVVGTDTSDASEDGTTDVDTGGTTPRLVFMLGTGNAFDGGSNNDLSWSYGAWADDAIGGQFGIGFRDEDNLIPNSGAQNPNRYLSTTRSLAYISNSALLSTLEIQSAADASLTDGFRVITRDGSGARVFGYLAIELDEDIFVDVQTVPGGGSTGIQEFQYTHDDETYLEATTTFAFLGVQSNADTFQGTNLAGATGFGIATGLEDFAHSIGCQNGNHPQSAARSRVNDRAIDCLRHNGDDGVIADFESFGLTGMTIDIETAFSPSNQLIGILAIGHAAIVAQPDPAGVSATAPTAKTVLQVSAAQVAVTAPTVSVDAPTGETYETGPADVAASAPAEAVSYQISTAASAVSATSPTAGASLSVSSSVAPISAAAPTVGHSYTISTSAAAVSAAPPTPLIALLASVGPAGASVSAPSVVPTTTVGLSPATATFGAPTPGVSTVLSPTTPGVSVTAPLAAVSVEGAPSTYNTGPASTAVAAQGPLVALSLTPGAASVDATAPGPDALIVQSGPAQVASAAPTVSTSLGLSTSPAAVSAGASAAASQSLSTGPGSVAASVQAESLGMALAPAPAALSASAPMPLVATDRILSIAAAGVTFTARTTTTTVEIAGLTIDTSPAAIAAAAAFVLGPTYFFPEEAVWAEGQLARLVHQDARISRAPYHEAQVETLRTAVAHITRLEAAELQVAESAVIAAER